MERRRYHPSVYLTSAYLILAAMLAGLLLIPSGCSSQRASPGAGPPAQAVQSAQEVRITVAATGDLLMHNTIVNSVYDSKTRRYDFKPVFTPIAPWLMTPDYTVANLETRLAGPTFGYSGYPRFNTPAELARDIREAGVDLVSTANNHSMDMGWTGVVRTLDNLDTTGVAHIGTHRSPAEKASPFIVDVRGIRLAWLNYTTTTNGLPLPSGKSFAVNLYEPGAAAAEAREARRNGADLVLAVIHFGNEYERHPDANQRQIALELGAAGVDVIINSHPHVVQPIEVFAVRREDGKTYNCVAAYSLGNFISDQRWRYSDSGIILYLEIVKGNAGARVGEIGYLPVWVHKSAAGGRLHYRVLPVSSAAPLPSDNSLTRADRDRMAEVWQELTAHLDNPVYGIRPYQKTPGADQALMPQL
jgi:poly-gamma-glutamate capsule biosynthesis protein CapA/YwtB (metallophosphatase superfamily)